MLYLSQCWLFLGPVYKVESKRLIYEHDLGLCHRRRWHLEGAWACWIPVPWWAGMYCVVYAKSLLPALLYTFFKKFDHMAPCNIIRFFLVFQLSLTDNAYTSDLNDNTWRIIVSSSDEWVNEFWSKSSRSRTL